MNGINTQLFGNDNGAYLESLEPALVLNYGIQFKRFSYGFGFGYGGDDEETDQHSSKMTFTRFNFHFGYHSNEDKRVYFSSRIAIGFTDFKLTGTTFTNPITFDSLLNQSKTSGVVSRSINLISNYNAYIEPQIGLVFHPKHQFKRFSESIEINVGYMYYGSIDWRTTGGQKISNVPLAFTGIPDCSLTFRIQRAFKRAQD